MGFGQLCEEFERSHFTGLSENTVKGHRSYTRNLRLFFGERKLANITVGLVETYRDERRQQPAKNRTGANSERGDGQSRARMFEMHAGFRGEEEVHRGESGSPGQTLQRTARETDAKNADPRRRTADFGCGPAPSSRGNHSSLPDRRKDIQRGIFTAMVTGGFRSEGHPSGQQRENPGSAEPIPLSQYACDVLRAWKQESSAIQSEYVFPSPVVPGKPISTVKTAWKATLRRARVPAFPIYNLRHVFCTRLSEVARMLSCSAPCDTQAPKPNVTTSWEWPIR